MDIRDDADWRQRYANYRQALQQLTKFIEKEELNELEEQGLIQAFEYTHELAWNLLRDYLLEKGHLNIHGSRETTRVAFELNMIDDADSWMEMIRDRRRSSQSYDPETAEAIAHNIKQRFFACFASLHQIMQALLDDK